MPIEPEPRPRTGDGGQTAGDGPRRPFFRRVEHPPFEPRRTNPTPDGWVSEPVGRWAGHETEVVYDPRRYAVMLMTETRADADVDAALGADGWERRADDGHCTLWVRDKLASARAALTRLDGVAAGVDSVAPGVRSGRPVAVEPVGEADAPPVPDTPPHRPAVMGPRGL